MEAATRETREDRTWEAAEGKLPAGSTFSAQLIYTLEGSPAPQSCEIQSPLWHSEHEQKGVPLKLKYLTTISIVSDASTRWPSRVGAGAVSRSWGCVVLALSKAVALSALTALVLSLGGFPR